MAAGDPLILVIDDDIGIRRLLRTGLELEGFAVVEAATLAQARSVRAEHLAGVVLDRQLPDGEGSTSTTSCRPAIPTPPWCCTAPTRSRPATRRW